jgi:hypothetical protein
VEDAPGRDDDQEEQIKHPSILAETG